MPAASMGNLNPMPDIKNVSYIHAGYEMTDKIDEEEKKYTFKKYTDDKYYLESIEFYIGKKILIINTYKK